MSLSEAKVAISNTYLLNMKFITHIEKENYYRVLYTKLKSQLVLSWKTQFFELLSFLAIVVQFLSVLPASGVHSSTAAAWV